MTLRELLNKSSYKSVFNEIYKNYYFRLPVEQVTLADISYQRVYTELKKKAPHDNGGCNIYITQTGKEEESYIDVLLYDTAEDSLYALDFCPWGQLIDCPIDKGVNIEDSTALAHILQEMTFHGFSEEVVAKERLALKTLKDRIDSGEEKVTPWGSL